ncbi:MAG TPA: VWA domain-containing protein [Patescibacteria group bacterium]|nr:VWA domain-containing protein [Patescibacteria group bacterium]
MGFVDYARSNSFEKDMEKLRIILVDDSENPLLQEAGGRFTISIPEPKFDAQRIEFLGYAFSRNTMNQQLILQLFRGAVYHLTSHVYQSNYEAYLDWSRGKNPIISRFVVSLLEDIGVISFLSTWAKDKLVDVCFTEAMALRRLRNLENVRIQATRIMGSLMIFANTGLRRYHSDKDKEIVEDLYDILDQYRKLVDLATKYEVDVGESRLETADKVYRALLNYGPLIESPSFPHTEYLGRCSLFPAMTINTSPQVDDLMIESLEALGVTGLGSLSRYVGRAGEARSFMVFDSYVNEKGRENRIVSRYMGALELSRLRGVKFPKPDYSGYLRAMERCKSDRVLMTQKLLVVMNAMTEDFRKKYGVLDLPDAIQVVASASERDDVFLRDEKIKQSYSWGILIDSSTSMRHIRDYTLEMAIILAESASRILLDFTSWGIFAFNDYLHIVKDFSEQYNTRVRSRLGGVEFGGLTYMPDAIEVVGGMLNRQKDEMKIMMIISDGWPYGYQNIYSEVQEVVRRLEYNDMFVLGIGAQSGRMEFLFESTASAFTLKEFVNVFERLYIGASEKV